MIKRKNDSTLDQTAYEKIKQMIFRRDLGYGQRLIYDELCKLLGMSRTPIVAAISRLENEGFLVSTPFKGYSVKPMDMGELRELYGIREALECYAVEQAIELFDEAAIEIVEQKALRHAQCMPAFYDPDKVTLDAEFHLQIAVSARNESLFKLLKRNLEHVHLRYGLEKADPRRMAPASREHMELVRLIKKRDALKSVKLLKQHLRSARDNVIASFVRYRDAMPIRLNGWANLTMDHFQLSDLEKV